MCIAAIAIQQSSEYPVIIIDNREEIVLRETIDACLQPKFNIVCGVDAQHMDECGTWMGYHVENGNFAVLTNVLEVSQTHHLHHAHIHGMRISRGVLVSNVIRNVFASDHLDSKNYPRYDGYNLIYGNLKEAHVQFTSNRTFESPPVPFLTKQATHVLEPGVHCVSNSYLNDLSWPKVQFLRNALHDVIKQVPENTTPEALRDELAPLLCSRPQFNQQSLPKYVQHELEVLQQLIDGTFSATVPAYYQDLTREELIIARQDLLAAQTNIFVQSKTEKTRSQTIILAHKSGQVFYYYRNTDKISAPAPIDQVLLPYNLYPNVATEAIMKPFALQGWKQVL